MNKILKYSSYIVLMLVLTCSCGPAKRIADGEVFLRKNKIEFKGNQISNDLNEEYFYDILKQKPNRKILFFRFNLAMYNMVNPNKLAKKHENKGKRLVRKYNKTEQKLQNATRNSKEQRLEKKLAKIDTIEYRTFKDWWIETVGEPPVLVDSSLVEKSTKQLGVYLSKKGYFNNEVRYEVIPNKLNPRKARVFYYLQPKRVYKVSCVEYEIEDKNLLSKTGAFNTITKLAVGQRFDVDQMDDDREAITDYLNNRGYYAFVKDYIQYEADSTLGLNKVDVYVQINSPTNISGDTIIKLDHQKYFIGDITIQLNYDDRDTDAIRKDTLYDNLRITYEDELYLKPKIIKNNIDFKKGEMYQKDRVEQTYRHFASLGIFDGVNIQFTSKKVKGNNILDCSIRLIPAKSQNISLEGTGTHRDGNLGVFGSSVYRHNNIFSGAESGEIRLVSGFEASQSLTSTGAGGDIEVGRGIKLNTFEIGPEFSLYLHNLFPYPRAGVTKSSNPKTKISAAYNFQKRPDFQRTVTQFKYTGSFTENVKKGSSFQYDLFNLSLINIDKTVEFQNFLDDLNNQILTASYNNHLVSSTKLIWIKNTQRSKSQRNYFYFKPSMEASGMLFRGLHNLTGRATNENGSYEIFDIPYANYVKSENDFRYYFARNKKNRFAFRSFIGVGYPLWNLDVLPFEKSFFSGGSNGIRAWQARSLGPGSYRDPLNLESFNNLGDIKIEGNLEYRFRMTDMFEGALFLDAGNIWLIEEDSLRPGSGFKKDKFFSEIAVGGGIGLRLDFEYFLVRFDFGIQLKDPAKVKGERWWFESKAEYLDYLDDFFPPDTKISLFPDVNFNLGIGYPF